jgi:hypothetical protein
VAQLVEALRYKPKVAGSVPDGVFEILHRFNPSDRIMALASTQSQPLTEMSTRDTPCGVVSITLRPLLTWKRLGINSTGGWVVFRAGLATTGIRSPDRKARSESLCAPPHL